MSAIDVGAWIFVVRGNGYQVAEVVEVEADGRPVIRRWVHRRRRFTRKPAPIAEKNICGSAETTESARVKERLNEARQAKRQTTFIEL